MEKTSENGVRWYGLIVTGEINKSTIQGKVTERWRITAFTDAIMTIYHFLEEINVNDKTAHYSFRQDLPVREKSEMKNSATEEEKELYQKLKQSKDGYWIEEDFYRDVGLAQPNPQPQL